MVRPVAAHAHALCLPPPTCAKPVAACPIQLLSLPLLLLGLRSGDASSYAPDGWATARVVVEPTPQGSLRGSLKQASPALASPQAEVEEEGVRQQ